MSIIPRLSAHSCHLVIKKVFMYTNDLWPTVVDGNTDAYKKAMFPKNFFDHEMAGVCREDSNVEIVSLTLIYTGYFN